MASYLEMSPAKQLSPLVKCFWISANYSGSTLKFSTLPDGCLELIASYRAGVPNKVMLYGILEKAYDDVVMPCDELKFGIRLKPLGQEFYIDMCSTLDRFIAFTLNFTGDLVNDLQRFAERVSEDMMNTVQPQAIDKRKLLLFEILEQSSGHIDIETVANNCCWSPRQINRYANSRLGMPLKSYCNILKCFASYSNIKKGDLTPDLGFYDQSHFIREIKKHTGATPKALKKNESHRYLQFNNSAL